MKPQQTVFVSDMDDTLFNDRKQISARNRKAIQEFQKAGGVFTVATGRSIVGFSPYQKELEIRVPVILYNGSCIYDYQKKEILWVRELEENVKDYVQEIMKQFPLLGVQIMTRKIYSCHPTPVCKEYIEREHLSYIEISDIREVKEPWIKVEFISDLVDREKLNTYITGHPLPGCRCIDTGEYSLEIVKEGVSKGDAVLRFRKIIKAEEKKLCCIGDHNNDYEMIRVADVGFAVKNALQHIKNEADIVVADNEHDGVAEAIEIMKQL
ncbi:MAG: HAD family hydrolase [Lachnospiraceae bacterium]|nr:HAD family hydrolase [Lachnospiraceae bacterium]